MNPSSVRIQILNLLQVQCRLLVLLQCLDGRIEEAAEGSQERNYMAAKTDRAVSWLALAFLLCVPIYTNTQETGSGSLSSSAHSFTICRLLDNLPSKTKDMINVLYLYSHRYNTTAHIYKPIRKYTQDKR
jgi:hypothetical protein